MKEPTGRDYTPYTCWVPMRSTLPVDIDRRIGGLADAIAAASADVVSVSLRERYDGPGDATQRRRRGDFRIAAGRCARRTARCHTRVHTASRDRHRRCRRAQLSARGARGPHPHHATGAARSRFINRGASRRLGGEIRHRGHGSQSRRCLRSRYITPRCTPCCQFTQLPGKASVVPTWTKGQSGALT